METIQDLENMSFPVPFSDCWIWMDKLSDAGYALLRGRRAEHYAHRLIYKLLNGDIPFDLVVMHSCDTPSCINPKHLSLGTRADNNKDRDNKGRHIALRGEAHGSAKLTKDAVLDIRSSRRPLKDLALKYNVSLSMISKVRAGDNWSHI